MPGKNDDGLLGIGEREHFLLSKNDSKGFVFGAGAAGNRNGDGSWCRVHG